MYNRLKNLNIMCVSIVFLFGLELVFTFTAVAIEKKKEAGGWEKDSVYDRYYDVKELED